MRQYIIRRLLATIPLLFVISFFCFIFINLIPSDPAEVALRVRQTPVITPEAIAQVRAELAWTGRFSCVMSTGFGIAFRAISA